MRANLKAAPSNIRVLQGQRGTCVHYKSSWSPMWHNGRAMSDRVSMGILVLEMGRIASEQS
jgi:hypothetical protein